MSPHAQRSFILAVMTVLVALFTWIYRGDRKPRARQWMLGWISIEAHFFFAVLVSDGLLPLTAGRWLGYTTILLSGACFFLSVSERLVNPRRRNVFWLFYLTPAIVYWTCMVQRVSVPLVYQGLQAVLIVTGISLALTGPRRPSPAIWISCGLMLGATTWTFTHAAQPRYGMDLILFSAFAITGLAYWRHFRRLTPGVLLTSISFLAWGLVWPTAELVAILSPAAQVGSFVWDIPKFFVAFGMILTLYEDQTETLLREVGERKQAELSLRDSQARLTRAQEMANLGHWEAPLDAGCHGQDCRWSGEIYRILGVDPERFQLTPESFFAAVHPDDRSLVRNAGAKLAATAEPYTIEYRVVRPDGTQRTVRERAMQSSSGDHTQAVIAGTVQDITEHRRLQLQLEESQRLESIGRLAGGVAHDFNNLLTVVNGYTEMLLEQNATSGAHRDCLVEILTAGRRAADLTSQLLAFSRKQIMQPALLNLNVIVDGMRHMVEALLGEDARLELDLCATLWPVKADPSKIQQMIVNLAANARDAMPAGGTLAIATSNEEICEEEARRHDGAHPGPYVMLSIRDTGIGMTPEVQSRLFEPFFTTKGTGKGPGLGLATVYGMTRQSEGWIAVQSQPGQGTTFRVYFPRAAASAVVPPSHDTGLSQAAGE